MTQQPDSLMGRLETPPASHGALCSFLSLSLYIMMVKCSILVITLLSMQKNVLLIFLASLGKQICDDLTFYKTLHVSLMLVFLVYLHDNPIKQVGKELSHQRDEMVCQGSLGLSGAETGTKSQGFRHRVQFSSINAISSLKQTLWKAECLYHKIYGVIYSRGNN